MVTQYYLTDKFGGNFEQIQYEKFFDENKSAFEIKLRDVLVEVLNENLTDKDLMEKISNEFIESFEKNVLSMTPFYQRKKK